MWSWTIDSSWTTKKRKWWSLMEWDQIRSLMAGQLLSIEHLICKEPMTNEFEQFSTSSLEEKNKGGRFNGSTRYRWWNMDRSDTNNDHDTNLFFSPFPFWLLMTSKKSLRNSSLSVSLWRLTSMAQENDGVESYCWSTCLSNYQKQSSLLDETFLLIFSD